MADSIENKETYEALREDGASKEKAAAIANAQSNGSIDYDSRPYEDRTRDELRDLARERHVHGRGSMTKQELIDALR